ncbi:hypothetical protein HOB96_00035, partial [bacterium]|nr:hypothetical protein [bacterium]
IIDGAGDILDKGSLIIKPGTITIRFLKEIDVSAYSSDKDGINDLREGTFKIFNENL